jgi:spore germination protein YaaH
MKRGLQTATAGLLAAVITATVLGPAAIAADPSMARQLMVTISLAVLNVRTGPGTSYAVLGQVGSGQTYPVLARSAAGWFLISSSKIPGGSGWVSGTYAKPAQAGPGLGRTITVTASGLNVRSTPSSTGRVLGQVTGGSTFAVMNAADGWYQIAAGSVIGWVSGSYVTLNHLVMGYNYTGTGYSYQEATARAKGVRQVIPTSLFLADVSGHITSYLSSTYVSWAQSQGLGTWGMVTNQFDQAKVDGLINSASARATFVKTLTQIAVDKGLTGINVDFENLRGAQRNGYTLILRDLAQGLHAQGKLLAVSIPPLDGTDWSEAYDGYGIGAAVDYVVVMAYEEHWDGDQDPGPVGDLAWTRLSVQRTINYGVPAYKLVLGLPLYTKDWATNSSGYVTSETIGMVEVSTRIANAGVAPVWDAASGLLKATYWEGSVKHQIWIEDANSTAAKARLANDMGLAGVAFWAVGYETPETWTKVLANLH